MRTVDAQLIEREYELDTIDRAVTTCRQGAGQLLLLEGAPGLGKSSLLAVLRRRAEAEDYTVLQARGDEAEGGYRYGVVRQLFEGWLASASPEDRRRGFRGPARPALPLLGYGPQDVAPVIGDRQHVLLNGLYWMCVHISERAPLTLLLDDAWWADLVSLRFLHYLTTRLDDQPILLAVTTDPAQKGRQVRSMHAIVSHPTARVLRLAPLSAAGVGACLGAWLGEEADSALVEACYQATGGIPFFLHELIDELAAAGQPEDGRPAAELVPDLAPPKVVRSVLRRLDPLPRPAVALLEAMAVLGAESDLRHAIDVAGIDQRSAAEALGALADSGLLHPGVPHWTAYPIVRAAIYHTLPATRRNAAHARAAQILAEAAAPADDIARHLLVADVAGDQAVVDRLRRAARTALADERVGTAVTYLTRALQEPPATEDEVTLLIELGRAELRARMPEALDHLSRALELSDDPVVRGRVGLDLAGGLVAAARTEEAVVLLERLRKEVEDRDEDLGGRLDIAIIVAAHQASYLRFIGAQRLSELGETCTANPGVARILAIHETARALRRGDPAGRVAELADEVLSDVLTDGVGSYDHDMCAHLWCNVATVLVCCDRLGDAERLLTHALADAQEAGKSIAGDSYRAVRSWVRYQRGRLVEAETDARVVLDSPNGFGLRSSISVFAVGALTRSLTARHELDAAKAVLDAHDFNASIRRSVLYIPVLLARGDLYGARGDYRTAADDLLHGCRIMEDWDMHNVALRHALEAAVLLHHTGRTAEACGMVERLLPRARQFGSPRAIAAALRARGLTSAAPAHAVALLEEAAELLADSEARLEYAATLVDLGAALRRCDRPVQARRSLDNGLLAAQDCGAWRLVKYARSELSAMGVRVRVTEAGADSLTAQERRVADMAAAGVRNRDIAQSLFVTVKTVEWHLNRAYRKLGITSRQELSEALAQERATVA